MHERSKINKASFKRVCCCCCFFLSSNSKYLHTFLKQQPHYYHLQNAAQEKYHLLEARKETFRGATMRGLKGCPRKVRWPHESPSEYHMAESGFYFTPSTGTDAGDAVTCYMCGCVIDGWDPEDDPVEVHYEHNAQCSKAILRKAPWKLVDDTGHDYFDPAHDPYSENSVLTRLESFFIRFRNEKT